MIIINPGQLFKFRTNREAIVVAFEKMQGNTYVFRDAIGRRFYFTREDFYEKRLVPQPYKSKKQTYSKPESKSKGYPFRKNRNSNVKKRTGKKSSQAPFSGEKSPAIFEQYPESNIEIKHGEESTAKGSNSRYGYNRMDGSPHAKRTPTMGYHWQYNKSKK